MKTLITRTYVDNFKRILFHKICQKCINKKTDFNGSIYLDIYKESVKEGYREFKKITKDDNIETELIFRYDTPIIEKITNLNYNYKYIKISSKELKKLYNLVEMEQVLYYLKKQEFSELKCVRAHWPRMFNNTPFAFDDELKELFNMLIFEGCYLYIKNNDKARIYFINKYLDITPISVQNFISFFGLKYIYLCNKNKSFNVFDGDTFDNKKYTKETHDELNTNLLSDKLKKLIFSVDDIMKKYELKNTFLDYGRYYYDNIYNDLKDKKAFYNKHLFITSHEILFDMHKENIGYSESILFAFSLTLSSDIPTITIYNNKHEVYTKERQVKDTADLFICLDEIQNSKTVIDNLTDIINTKKNLRELKYNIIKNKYEDMLKHGISGFCVKEDYSLEQDNKILSPYYKDLLFKIE